MNVLYELDRLKFYLKRDGLEAALKAAKQMMMIYRTSALAFKKKPGGKNHPYRFSYIESAYSARHILRQRLLEKLNSTVIIDLSGPDGNAFAILGYAMRFASERGLDYTAISEDMQSSDYDHLVEVFVKHFGEFVTLYR